VKFLFYGAYQSLTNLRKLKSCCVNFKGFSYPQLKVSCELFEVKNEAKNGFKIDSNNRLKGYEIFKSKSP
jgi:hypothetical protein